MKSEKRISPSLLSQRCLVQITITCLYLIQCSFAASLKKPFKTAYSEMARLLL